jgi:cobalt-precorrin-5B (C1)-methyltransferase
VKEAVDELGLKGAEVIISIPDGEKIGKETLNSKIGVEGGISILGSTGFVEPWNDHLGEMKGDLIRCTDKVVLTTGRIGMRYSHMLFPDMLEGSGYATVVEMLEKKPEHPRLKEAFEMAIEKGKGARIVVIDRDGSSSWTAKEKVKQELLKN